MIPVVDNCGERNVEGKVRSKRKLLLVSDVIKMVVKPAVIPSELSSTPSATLVSLSVQLDLSKAAETYSSQIDSISANFRASCYLATAQIFLKSNATLERKLEVQDVKERLLGHFVIRILFAPVSAQRLTI